MVNQVDKPPLQLSFVNPVNGHLTKNAAIFLHRLWERVGDRVDNAIDSIGDGSESSVSSSNNYEFVELLEDMVDDQPLVSNSLLRNLEIKTDLEITVLSADTTISDKGIYIVDTAGITVTMPSSPDEGAGYIFINNSNGIFNLAGNGKNISGKATQKIAGNYSAPQLAWSDNQDEWFFI